MYFTYKLSKKELGDYLNVWFDGKKINLKDGMNFRDEVITLKEVDEETANHLYNRIYNPVSIVIMSPAFKTEYNEKNEILYNMKFQVHSIDDSSYGIWWNGKPLSELESIKENLMKIISNTSVINGENLLDSCIELGADKDSKDYN
jgi:hypothetical protein